MPPFQLLPFQLAHPMKYWATINLFNNLLFKMLLAEAEFGFPEAKWRLFVLSERPCQLWLAWG